MKWNENARYETNERALQEIVRYETRRECAKRKDKVNDIVRYETRRYAKKGWVDEMIR